MATTTFKKEIAELIEKGRRSGIDSEAMVDEIFKTAINESEFVVCENEMIGRSLTIDDVCHLAGKALQQAAFDGAVLVLSSGKVVKRRPDATA